VHPTALDNTHLGQDIVGVVDAKEIGSLRKKQQGKGKERKGKKEKTI